MKRLLTILAVLVVLCGVALGVYFVFFSSSAPHLTATSGPAFTTSTAERAASTTATNKPSFLGNAGKVYAPGLIQITTDPVAAGVAIFTTVATTSSIQSSTSGSTTSATTVVATSTQTAVNYIDRASGNVYQYLTAQRTLTRIGNKTLPGIQQSSWLPNGSLALAQFISNTDGTDHVETYALPSTSTEGFFLQQDLEEAVAAGPSSIFTLAAGTGSSIGTVASADGSTTHTLFSSALTALQVYPTTSGYVASTRAANSLAGYAFTINSSGNFSPILGPFTGLTILPSPSGRFVLFSFMNGSDMAMGIFDRSTGASTQLPLATLAEKCTWSADETTLFCAVPEELPGTLPDDWYQGAVSFNDRIWRIDLASRLATLVLDPSTVNTSIDAVNLTVDSNSQVLVFRNKKDESLWADTL